MTKTPITPKRAYKMLRDLEAWHEDPMTIHYGAGEHVNQMFGGTCSRLGTSPGELEELAHVWAAQCRAKRNAHRDPARLRWRERESMRREYLASLTPEAQQGGGPEPSAITRAEAEADTSHLYDHDRLQA